MKSQLQECIEMLRTENSSISDRLLNMERLRLKVQGANVYRSLIKWWSDSAKYGWNSGFNTCTVYHTVSCYMLCS